MFYAHSGNPDDKSDWQQLAQHLAAVARIAADMASVFGGERAAHLAGMLHDLGKYTPAMQRRLEGADIRVDHSTAGGWHALQAVGGRDRFMAELIGYAILGHHAGLPDMRGTESSLSARLARFSEQDLDAVWQSELELGLTDLAPPFEWQAQSSERLAFQVAFLGRMLFSCLVDADFKDTEAFYGSLKGTQADRAWSALGGLLPGFLSAFDACMADKAKVDNDINRLRSDILAHVRGKAGETPGLFTLTVPTGGGKTLASLGFALDHAAQHGHRRIIYAIPFTSIIDQTVGIFRGILGADNVLEHHSAIDEEKIDPEIRKASRDKLKIAMEDWAAPVVVTTNVQLFESLFAAKTSRARKLHNIAGSIIILDEAQTIPRHLLAPAVQVLDELARNYRCTIILCTATQPALDKRNFADGHVLGLALEGRELAPGPAHLAKRLKRASLELAGEMSNADLIAALDDNPQALVIVNSRKHALELFRQAQDAGLDGLVHLTTRQYAAHRRIILADIRERLKSGKPCRVIATSLIEAGVDVDFPRAWRTEAGLDSLVQAAGRVNREGKRPIERSIVTVFKAPDYPPPSEIRGLIGDFSRIVGKHDDLMNPDAIAEYFSEVYWRAGEKGLDAKSILGRFRIDPTQLRPGTTGTDFGYRSAAEDFRMIDSRMAPVIIARDPVAIEAVEKLGIENILSGAIARKLQSYIVQVTPQARDLLLANGHVAFVRPDLRADQFAVLQTESLYTEAAGLIWEDAAYLAVENSVI